MAKAEISWKRVAEDGTKLQVYAQHVGREWKFFHREKRFDQWRLVEAPLEDWMELLESIQRLIVRRRYQPVDEEDIRKKIRDRFPEADV